ncbi:MAG: hypothetical protein HXY50_11400 [Ignavibacteriaceae bacterium]|nr:hypothetical protein [Ignavibacteriaceae bacterium]
MKEKLAGLIVSNKYKSEQYTTRSFRDFFKKSFSFLVLMPDNDTDFHYAIEVLKGLSLYKKHATVFTQEFRANLVPIKYRPQVIEYTDKDIGRLFIPSKKLMEKLASMRFNAILDLNRKENIFCSIVSNLVNAPVKAGFQKNNADKYYNLQIVNKEENPELSYKNYLNCLEMF